MNSITPVTVTTEWQDLYALTGVDAGEPLLVQVQGGTVRISIGDTAPTDAVAGYAGQGQWVDIPGGNSGAWVRSNGGESTIAVQVADTAVRPFPYFDPAVFEGMRAITTQPYTEANVKQGRQYYVRVAYPLGNPIPANEERKIHFVVGDEPVTVKRRDFEYVGEELEIELFSAPLGVSGGSSVQVSNWNGVYQHPSVVTVTRDVSTTNDGAPLESGPEYMFGSSNNPNRQPNSIPIGRERVLPPNTEYLVVIRNNNGASARCQYTLDWYQGPLDIMGGE